MRIINIMAVSLDGKIATSQLQNDAGRMSYGFGCQADHDFVLSEISKADAIITGANSIRASGGVWDAKGAGGKFPDWYVLSNSGLDSQLRFWQQKHIPRYIISKNALPDFPDPSVSLLRYTDKSLTDTLISHLKSKNSKTVLLFGGGIINQIFYSCGLVDELKVTISPVIVGRSDAPEFVTPTLATPTKLRLQSSQMLDNHLFLHYSIQKN